MNDLVWCLAVILAVVTVVIAWCHITSPDRSEKGARSFVIGLGAVLIVGSISVYAALGRFGDWQQQEKDDQVDYLLAARITEARRQVKESPENYVARLSLAQAYMEGGRYIDAVDTLDACLTLTGPRADILGMKVQAMYYRDGRRLTDKTREVIARVFELDELEVQTRMLLGQDAYLNGRFEEAIKEWKLLVDARIAPEKENALLNAIANAERRIVRKD